MAKFPVDAPLERVLRALQMLGFAVVRAETMFLWCAGKLTVHKHR